MKASKIVCPFFPANGKTLFTVVWNGEQLDIWFLTFNLILRNLSSEQNKWDTIKWRERMHPTQKCKVLWCHEGLKGSNNAWYVGGSRHSLQSRGSNFEGSRKQTYVKMSDSWCTQPHRTFPLSSIWIWGARTFGTPLETWLAYKHTLRCVPSSLPENEIFLHGFLRIWFWLRFFPWALMAGKQQKWFDRAFSWLIFFSVKTAATIVVHSEVS